MLLSLIWTCVKPFSKSEKYPISVKLYVHVVDIRYHLILQIPVIYSHLKLWISVARHNFK